MFKSYKQGKHTKTLFSMPSALTQEGSERRCPAWPRPGQPPVGKTRGEPRRPRRPRGAVPGLAVAMVALPGVAAA